MRVIPENEKLIQLDGNDDDDEGWVDTHHGVSKSAYAIVSTLHMASSIIFYLFFVCFVLYSTCTVVG